MDYIRKIDAICILYIVDGHLAMVVIVADETILVEMSFPVPPQVSGSGGPLTWVNQGY